MLAGRGPSPSVSRVAQRSKSRASSGRGSSPDTIPEGLTSGVVAHRAQRSTIIAEDWPGAAALPVQKQQGATRQQGAVTVAMLQGHATPSEDRSVRDIYMSIYIIIII